MSFLDLNSQSLSPFFRSLKPLKPDPIDKFLKAKTPKFKIYTYKGWITANGNDLAALNNQRAVDLLIQLKYREAKNILSEVSQKSPQFFPGRFNLGRLYLILKDYEYSLRELKKTALIIPQYSKTYLYIGDAYEKMGDTDLALEQYRISYRKNPFDLTALIRMGDLYSSQKLYHEAARLFKFCLQIDSGNNHSLIGLAKIAYQKKDYYDATLLFHSVDQSKEFDPEMHFYYAESSFFAHDYKIAIRQYEIMMKHIKEKRLSHFAIGRISSRKRQAERLQIGQQK